MLLPQLENDYLACLRLHTVGRCIAVCRIDPLQTGAPGGCQAELGSFRVVAHSADVLALR